MITAELLSSFTIGHQADLKPLSFGEDVWKAAPAQQADRCKRLKNLAMGLTDVLAVPLASAGLLRFDAHQDPKSTKEGIIDDHISSTKPQYNHFKLYQTPRSQNSPAPTKPKIQVLSSDDSDDDFIPYDMPTEDDAVLAEGEDISTFTQPKDKPKPPVYLADLANYLKSSEDVNKIELGLAYAATLIRKRAAWGTELGECPFESYLQ